MKRSLLVLISLISITSLLNAQSLSVLSNPDNGNGVNNTITPIAFGNNFYYCYGTASNIWQLSKCDGNNSSIVSSFPSSGFNLMNPILFGSNFYFVTRNNSNNHLFLTKSDGTTQTIISNPDGGTGVAGGAIVYGSNLYFIYITASGKTSIAKYDGNTISIISNPDGGSGFQSGNAIIYNNKLYYSYQNASGHIQLAEYDGTNLTLINNPSNSDYGFLGYPIVYNNKLYFQYQNSSGKNLLAYYDGTNITLVNNLNSSDYGNAGTPIIYNNKLYFSYTNSSFANQLAQFDGTNLSLINNPDNKTGFSGSSIIYQNNLYFIYSEAVPFSFGSNINYLGKFDGTSLTLINNPDGSNGINGAITVFNNNLYFNYSNSSNKNVSAYYNGTSINLNSNPDAGTFIGDPFIFQGNLYNVYQDASNISKWVKFANAITVQPSTSTQTLCVGSTATALSVNAIGTGLTYQWYSNTSNSIIGGSLINSATNNSYTPSTATSGLLYYYVIVSGSDLSTVTSTVSGGITVTVNSAPVSSFVTTPSVLCSGFPVQFNGPSACGSNGALNFSGSSSSALHSTVTSAIDNITIEVWAKWSGNKNSQSDDQEIFYNGHTGNGGYGILMTATGDLKILIGGKAYLESSMILTPGIWEHIAIVRNSGTWSLYLNGTQHTVSPNNTTPNSPTAAGGNHTCIGADESGTGHLFYGSLDEVKFWTVARSTAYIQSDMTDCSVSAQSGLLAYWSFNDGSGSTASDGSGNINTLNLTNTNWLSSGAPTGATYAWNYGDGSSSILASDVHTYASSGSKSPILTVTSLLNGCSSSSSGSITVNLSPTASISGTATSCNIVSLTASGGSTYSWNGGNATTSATNTFNSSNNYIVTVTDGIGCTSTASQSVTVNSLPASPTSGPVPTISTFAPNLNGPDAITFDGSGNLYSASQWSGSISKIASDGTVTSFVTNGTFNSPSAIAFYSGTIYVAEPWNNKISKVASNGIVSNFVNAGLNNPIALVTDGSGILYVANQDGSINKIATNGTVSTLVNSGGAFNCPSALAFAGGILYVADQCNNSISKVASDGTVTSFVNSGLNNPSGLTFDALGNLFVANQNGGSIIKVAPDGTKSTFVSTGLSNPTGLVIDASKNLFTIINSSDIDKIIPPAAYITSVCDNGTVSLISSPAAGEITDWYGVATGGSALLAGSNNYTTPSISTSTLYYAEARNTTTGCISSTRTSLLATVNNCANTWTGTTNTDWATATNWSYGTVPVITDAVIVPSVPNQPVINNSTTASLNNLTINSSATLSVNGVLQIGGTISNSGTITVTSGTITMNGSSAQTIPASTFSTNTIKNLIVNNSAGITLTGTLNVTGTITPTSGVLTTGGFLTLVSTVSGSGIIAQGSGSYISGNVTVQRYVGSNLEWRMIGFPFTAATTISESTLAAFYSSGYKAYTYNEAGDNGAYNSSGGVNAGWNAFTSGTITSDKGLLLSGGTIPSIINFNGPINTGSQNITLSYSSGSKGWNLIANPFASNIDWDLVHGHNGCGLDNAVYRYDPNTTAYATYVNLFSTGNQSKIIENGASFFVHSSYATSMGIFETDKTSSAPLASLMGLHQTIGTISVEGTNNTPITAQYNQSIIKLSLSKQGDIYGDEVVLRWGGPYNVTDHFDSRYDAYDRGRQIGPDLSVIGTDSTVYSIFHGSALNSSNAENRTVQLGLNNMAAGAYQIKLGLLSSLANGNQAYLIDRYSNENVLIGGTDSVYAFTVNADILSQSAQRFAVTMNYKAVDHNTANNDLPVLLLNNPSTGNLFTLYSKNTYNQLQWEIVDDAGRLLQTGLLSNVLKGSTHQINAGNTKHGSYFIKLTGDGSALPVLKALKN